MATLPAGFRAALLIGWVALAAAGIAYAQLKSIPNWAAYPALAAFLIEYPFYLLPAFPALRATLKGPRLYAYVIASAILPYLVCCFGAVTFEWSGLLRLLAFGIGMGFWYVILPHRPIVDLAFLALVPALLVGGFFHAIYVPRFPAFKDIVVLGHLSLIQIAVVVLMEQRRVPEVGYGFVPNLREWRIGTIHFFYFLAAGIPLALLLGIVGPPHLAPPWKVLGTFFGFLWVGSLSEEFLVRGVLLHWLAEWTRSLTAALILSSIVFGLVHLWFGGDFPNYKWVAIASILGWFCGRARLQAGSIRAGMVTHALVVTARLFVA